MRRTLIIIAAVMMLAACSPRIPLYQAVVESEMARNPEATYIDGQNGKIKWNYTTGLELLSFLDVAARQKDILHAKILDYVDAWYDAAIDNDGTIYKYKQGNYSLDHICPGRTLFQLYDLTGKAKYRKAMDVLYAQLQSQPRTKEGGFWHKQIYPDQMWLDGLYMAEPFYAEYTVRYVTDLQEKAANFADIAQQFIIVAEHTYDSGTQLYRHAWDSSHKMFWASPYSGKSAHAWGRALGWYMMALADVLPLLPENTPGRDRMLEIFRNLAEILPKYADPETGMWYQVLDCPGAEGNYTEATASAMFIYAMAKGSRLGYVNCLPYAREAYKKLQKTFVTREKGLVNLNRCCEVAGLGGKNFRSGEYDYYINEKVRSNDPKGIGPLIWAALELEQPDKR
ncbi:MAG: glycoside hydrolase family 88 protein [Bacteroidales bacterium]|nr:glycoside hydrolase family 88 protein [Bacteroidales bacterium]